jgi:hypothetical protein
MPKQVKSSELAPAVGYVRLDDDAGADVLASHLKDIADCCQREDLRLKQTFMDRGYDGTQLARPGIVELQQALKDIQGLAVVLPTVEHLSPADAIRRALVLMIRRLDGHLVIIHKDHNTDPNPSDDATAHQTGQSNQDGSSS